MRSSRHASIGLGAAGLVLVLVSCGGGTIFSPPPINLSVSVNDTTVVVAPNGSPVNVPVVIMAPTETATFAINGLPAGVTDSYKESESNPSGLLTLVANSSTKPGTLYAHHHRWLVGPNCVGRLHPGDHRAAYTGQLTTVFGSGWVPCSPKRTRAESGSFKRFTQGTTFLP